MARKRATITDLLNDLTFRTTFEKFKMMAMNRFEYDGLPDGILPRHIERVLFDRGYAAFFKDPDMAHMCLEVKQDIDFNVYGDPLWYTAFGFNYNRRLAAEECVIIENNLLRLPTRDVVMFYVNKITEAERTMDVNVKANKTPIIFACDDRTVLSFRQIFRQVDGNEPAVFADPRLNIESITAFDTKVKFLGNELMDYKRSVESELLTYLGINNSPIDKKERLITDEANSNNQLIDSFFQLQLEARERAVQAINEMFGLSVTVKPRQASVEEPVETVEEGDEDA